MATGSQERELRCVLLEFAGDADPRVGDTDTQDITALVAVPMDIGDSARSPLIAR
jgi:hypothetical protein